MKKSLILLVLFLIANTGFSQEAVSEKTFPYTGQELDLDMEFGDEVIIKAWDKNEVYIKVTYEIDDGELNDALKLDFDDYKDRVSVDLDLDMRKMRNSTSRSRNCGNDRNWNGSYYSDDNYGVCAKISVEVFIPKEADLWINTIVADVEVRDMVGNIEVETVTGHIDVAWAEALGADVRMKTVTGAVYTNFEFDSKRDKGLKLISSHDIKAVYKSGGKEVSLENVTGDIYLRKSRE
jgi:hypothetical protein